MERFIGFSTTCPNDLYQKTPYTDYIFFLLAGSLGGAILIFFLNRQSSVRARWIVLIVFLLVTPVSLFLMLGGGLLGPLGTLILPQIPWALFTWLGALLGRLVSRASKE